MRRSLVLASLGLGLSGAAFAQAPVPWPTPAPAVVAPAPPAAPVYDGPRYTVQTSMGDVVIALDTVHAPKTAANFQRYVKSGHWVGAAVYRIEKDFIIQLGDEDAAGKYRKPIFPGVPLETENNPHSRGAVALAHGDNPNDGQATWYFDLGENKSLNAKEGAAPNTTGYAVFAHVVEGMDVLDKMAAVELSPTGGSFPGKKPKAPITVKKIIATPYVPAPVVSTAPAVPAAPAALAAPVAEPKVP